MERKNEGGRQKGQKIDKRKKSLNIKIQQKENLKTTWNFLKL